MVYSEILRKIQKKRREIRGCIGNKYGMIIETKLFQDGPYPVLLEILAFPVHMPINWGHSTIQLTYARRFAFSTSRFDFAFFLRD